MKLLYISTFMFEEKEGCYYGLPSCSDRFFEKYLDVFDSVKVLGEKIKPYLDSSKLVKISNPKIEPQIIIRNTSIKEIKNDRKLKKILTKEIFEAESILIKPSTRRGMMAIKIAEKLKKPYMIEMTGDIHNALMQSPSRIRRMYATIIYRQIKKSIKNCQYGLYVSNYYLQNKYPIAGKMCGCSDVELELSNDEVLKNRIKRIESFDQNQEIKLALVGFYQGNGKGIDTAIRALSKIPDNYKLYVLGNGTQESRNYWYDYCKKNNVDTTRLIFPQPLSSSQEVLQWLDEMDLFVFPTRSEGLSRALAEAMSRGIPCLATNICTMPELLPEECLFELDNDCQLSELILKFVCDKLLMKEMAKINFEKAKVYNFYDLKKKRNAFLREFKNYCINRNGK